MTGRFVCLECGASFDAPVDDIKAVRTDSQRGSLRIEAGLKIRRALQGESDTLSKHAFTAKRHWQSPEEWFALWHDSSTATDAYSVEHQVFVAEVRNTVAGFYALVQTTEAWELDHLWIDPDFMDRGIGRALFTHAIQQLKLEAPGTILDIEADPNAESFYLDKGTKRIEEISRNWQDLIRHFATPAVSIEAG